VKTLSTLLFCAVLSSSLAFGWGPLGHRIVAETAALLVADDLPTTWGPLLARHRFELGVYAFLPDASFRHIDGAGGKLEAPSHYLNLDGERADGTGRGSVDRRVAQFLGLAEAQFDEVKKPPGGYQRGASSEGDARRIFLGLYNLGVMAHYAGDASMPFHATADWDGVALGEGGIHFYFESDCVNALEPGLAADVLASARRHRAAWVRTWKADSARTEDMVRAVLAEGLAAVADVSALDLAHAVTRRQAPGTKTPALRKPPAVGCRAMRPLIVDRLARGAVLTAALWERVLPVGVDFSGAADLHYSDMVLAPDYVAPR
jgi:hypothetical protein